MDRSISEMAPPDHLQDGWQKPSWETCIWRWPDPSRDGGHLRDAPPSPRWVIPSPDVPARSQSSCLPLTTAQATALGRDSRRRVPSEQCGLEHMRRPAPRLANPDRSHAARMLAHPVPTTFQPYSRRAGRSSCCWPKSWPKLLFGSNLVQAHAATNSFMSGLPTSEMRPLGLLMVVMFIPGAHSARASEAAWPWR